MRNGAVAKAAAPLVLFSFEQFLSTCLSADDSALTVGEFVGADHDEVDQCPDATESAEDDSENKLTDAFAGISGVEVVDAKRADQVN